MEPYLSIVVPVFDEEENVGPLCDELCEVLESVDHPYEIIIVNDGSGDETLARLQAIVDERKAQPAGQGTIRVVCFSRNFGQTPAMQAGFDLARGAIVISMDGDMQNDPHDIPRLLEKLAEGYDVVSGWRKDRQDNPITRTFPSRIANWMISQIAGVAVHDNGCSLKAYRSTVVKAVSLYSDMHRFIPALATSVGARVGEIVVNHRPRERGQSKYGLTRTWKVLLDLVTIRMLIHFYYRPLFWFAGLGFASFIGGLAFALASAVLYMQGEVGLMFLTSSLLLFSLTATLISWGLLGEFFVRLEKKRSVTMI